MSGKKQADLGGVKRAWERRLKDLLHLLESCAATYFDPELFRRNTNQFLQTARTVTFLIQKNKAQIPDFESWHGENVLDAWRDDQLMRWAKEARNFIEKEGDLETSSTLRATLLFSYLSEDDVVLECGKQELLHANIKKLVRLAQKKLPAGVADAAVIKIERRWVTESLPEWELLQALHYVFSRLLDCCSNLAQYLGASLELFSDEQIERLNVISEARQTAYLKLRLPGVRDFSLSRSVRIFRAGDFEPSQEFRDVIVELSANKPPPATLQDVVDYYSEITEFTYERDGAHVPLLLMFDESWRLTGVTSSTPEDQADKFIFWREMAEEVRNTKAKGIVWISEAWIRNASEGGAKPIHQLPIEGEILSFFAFDNTGNVSEIEWSISRPNHNGPGVLKRVAREESRSRPGVYFALAPVMRAMGVPDSAWKPKNEL